MSNYLERYQQGEYIQVWQELVAVGDQVRTEPLYNEARAVAQETMRRARHNVDLLVGRLQGIGYQFLDPSAVFTPTPATELDALADFEREVGPLPLTFRAWFEQVGMVNFMGNYPKLSYYAPWGSLVIDGVQINPDDLFKPQTSIQTPNAGKAIPEADQVMSDPLVIELYNVSVDEYKEWQEYDEGTTFFAGIAPDIYHKSNYSGGGEYSIALPNAVADAPLVNTECGPITFVEYLRLSFAWAGFPGLKDYVRRDEDLLASLKEGLLPL